MLCIDFSTNNAAVAGLDDYVLLQHATSTFTIDGLTGAGTNAVNVQDYVTGQNTTGTTIVAPAGAIRPPVDNVVNFGTGTCNM